MAPGLKEGMTFDDLDMTSRPEEPSVVSLADLMSAADLDEFNFGEEEDKKESEENDPGQGQIQGDVILEEEESLENLVKVSWWIKIHYIDVQYESMKLDGVV